MFCFKYFLEPNAKDSHQTSHYWLALVTRFAVRNTVDPLKVRRLDQTKMSASLDEARANPVAEDEPLLLSSEIASWSVQTSKNTPQGTATFSLQPMAVVDIKGNKLGYDWRRFILGGDWIMFWAFDNQADYLRVKERLKAGKTANGFMDGLKFIGRVQSVRRRRTRNQMSGTPETSYTMSAISGKELASKIYYNPALMDGKFGADKLDFIGSFSKVMMEFLANPDVFIPADKAITLLLKACLGMAPSDTWSGLSSSVLAPGEETPAALVASPNGRLLVPETVWKTLEGGQYSGPDRKAHDIIRGLVGRQVYTQSGMVRRSALPQPDLIPVRAAEGFTPTLEPMDGESTFQSLDMGGKAIWSILGSYLNEPINEMFYTLRANNLGDVLPTVVARQMPFTSIPFWRENPRTTPFLNLPRWVISPKMVLDEDFGASDALRSNFVLLQARDQVTGNQGEQAADNMAKYPPIADMADIERNGLYWYSKQLGSHLESAFDEALTGRYWTRLMTDATMDQHLKFTGGVTTTFIQEPIPIGDNVQYDGGIYHIESITHQGAISADGRKTATTSLSLAHGISTDSELDKANANVYMVDYLHENNDGFQKWRRASEEPSDRGGDRVFFGHNQDVVKRKT